MLDPIFTPFIENSPISIMSRGLLENALNPDQLDEWFDSVSQEQYPRELLFSTTFDLMGLVVRGSFHSVHAAYQVNEQDVGVSITSVYNKLQGIEPDTSAGLVRYATGKMEPIIKTLGGTAPPPLPGQRLKLLDGNCIEKTEHRIDELRSIAAGPLPGKSLVVYDPVLRLPIDVFPCEDGHAQERSLLNKRRTTPQIFAISFPAPSGFASMLPENQHIPALWISVFLILSFASSSISLAFLEA